MKVTQEEYKAIGHVAETGNDHQDTENPGEETGFENQIPAKKGFEAEKYQGDAIAIIKQLSR